MGKSYITTLMNLGKKIMTNRNPIAKNAHKANKALIFKAKKGRGSYSRKSKNG